LIRIYTFNEKANPYLQFFLEFVNEQVTGAVSQLDEFIKIWEQSKDDLSIKMPGDIKAVRIYTIHKAKGLEFPVVIYPFVDDTLDLQRNRLWLDVNNSALQELPVTLSNATESLKEAGYESEYNQEVEKSNLDLVNLMYVAMTRPIEKLYVLASKTGKMEPIANGAKLEANKLLWMYVHSENDYEKGKLEFLFTEGTVEKIRSDKAGSPVINLEKIISNEWKHKIRIASKVPKIEDREDIIKGRNWGNIVHEALSRILHSSDLEFVVNSCAKDFELSETQVDDLTRVLNKVIEHPNLSIYFSGRVDVKSEAEILTPSGSVYRPDRVIIDRNEVVIIDYKTGNPSAFHHQQVKDYADLLKNMGYLVKEKHLVYVGGEFTVENVA
jgi:ATP-dependent exoDNAse (exonuclease V) beta subunit